MIKTSGHLIGPFEVESVLMEHPAVAEAGVIGKPDPVAGEVVKAFVGAQGRLRAERGAPARAPRARAQAARRGGRAEGDRVRREPAEDPQRQDHAAAAQGARARAARRRHLDAGGHLNGGRASSAARSRARRASTRTSCCGRCCSSAASRRSAAELYSAGKIRGFLHLYIGEEAVAVGAMQALVARRCDRRDLPRARPRARARHPGRRGDGGDVRQGERLQPRPRRLDAPVRRARAASTAATRSSAAGCRSRSGSRSPTSCRDGSASPRASSATVRWPKASSTSRSTSRRCGSCRCCSCARTTCTRWAPRSRARSPRPTSTSRRRTTACRPSGWTAWTCYAVESAVARAAEAVRRGDGPYFLELRTYRFRAHSMYDPELYRGKDEVEEWKKRDPIADVRRAAEGRRPARRRRARGAREERRGRTSTGRSTRPSAATWEPVEDLERDVHTAGPDGEDDLPRSRPRRHARGDARRPARVPDGRGRGPLRRRVRGEPRPARRVRPGAHPRHAALGVDLRRRGHRRGDRRHAADRRGDDDQLLPARARPDRQHRRDAAPHVRRTAQRAGRDPHGDRRRPRPRRAALALVRGLVRARARASRSRRRRRSPTRRGCSSPRSTTPTR